MAKTLQFRRGSTATINGITPAVGELLVDTTKKTVVVGDGTTAGGTPLQTALVSSDGNLTLPGNLILPAGGDIKDSTGASVLGAGSSDIIPSIGDVYDLGSTTSRWNDAFISNSVNINGAEILGATAGISISTLLAGNLLIDSNLITPDSTTVNEYLGDKGIVIVNGNIDAQGDWVKLPLTETVGEVLPSTLGQEGSIRYNKDTGAAQIYTDSWTDLAISEEANFLSPYIDVTGHTLQRSYPYTETTNTALPFIANELYYIDPNSSTQHSIFEPAAALSLAKSPTTIQQTRIAYYGLNRTNGNFVIATGVPSGFDNTRVNIYSPLSNSLHSTEVFGQWTVPSIMPVPGNTSATVVIGATSTDKYIAYISGANTVTVPTQSTISSTNVGIGVGASEIDPNGDIWTVGVDSSKNIKLTKIVAPSGFAAEPAANTLSFTSYTLDLQATLNSRYTMNNGAPQIQGQQLIAVDSNTVAIMFAMQDKIADGQYAVFVALFNKNTNTFTAPLKVSKGYNQTNVFGHIAKANPDTSEFLCIMPERDNKDGISRGYMTASLVAIEGGVLVETATSKTYFEQSGSISIHGFAPRYITTRDDHPSMVTGLLIKDGGWEYFSLNIFHSRYGQVSTTSSLKFPQPSGSGNAMGLTSWYQVGTNPQNISMFYTKDDFLQRSELYQYRSGTNPAEYGNKVYVSKAGTSKLYKPGNTITIDLVNKYKFNAETGNQRGAVYVDRAGQLTSYSGDTGASNVLLGYIVGYNKVLLA